jgi:hypothetical protein
MEAEIAQQNKIQASILRETYLTKKSANELQDQIANLSIALREQKAEERRLSKEVVHTPDRIRSDLAKATRRFECVRRSISDAQAERASVQKWAEHASMAEDVAGRIAAVMEGMDTVVQYFEMAAQDLENAQSTLKRMRMERDKEGTMEEKESQDRKLDTAGKLSYFPMNRIESPPQLTHSLTRLYYATNDAHSTSAMHLTTGAQRSESPTRRHCSSTRCTISRTISTVLMQHYLSTTPPRGLDVVPVTNFVI